MSQSLLTDDIGRTVKEYSKLLKKDVTFVLQTGEHPKRNELIAFLSELSQLSDVLNFEEADLSDPLRSPISFTLKFGDDYSGIIFSGLPGGHEFNSLVLAMLHGGGGADLKLDASLINFVSKISNPIRFETFVSLSCENCPDVVQMLNKFAVMNENISAEMIDGGLFPEEIESKKIQGVPCVYLNGELFLNGRVDSSRIAKKLLEVYPELLAEDEELGEIQDLTVVGGGPAGIAASIYAARKGLKTSLIVEKMGGQVADTVGIENMISMPKTTGLELTKDLATHLEGYNVSVRELQRVTSVTPGDLMHIQLASGEIVRSRSTIIATGAAWKKLGIPGEEENIGRGVAFCPHCEGPFFKGKRVIVIGGGNSGLEAALDLCGIVELVTIMEFLPNLNGDQILLDQIASRSNIDVITNASCQEIHSSNQKVESVSYIDRASEEVNTITANGVFVQIGLVPNSQFVKELLHVNAHGEIIVNEKGETSVDGIFACGDVTTVPYKQISIAIGDGAKASIAAAEYLQKLPMSSENVAR